MNLPVVKLIELVAGSFLFPHRLYHHHASRIGADRDFEDVGGGGGECFFADAGVVGVVLVEGDRAGFL